MNKQLVQDIIKVGNKAMDIMSIRYTVDTKDNRYCSYDGLYYDDNHVEFTNDCDNDVVLSYDEITGIKVSNLWYK